MAAKQFFIPHLTATVAGIAQPGARFYFYATGTLTPESIFSDSGLSVERTNPVVCDASGALPVTYLDNTKTYRVRICDKNDVLLSGGDIDPFIPGVFPDAAVLQPYQDAAEDAATAAAASASAAATSATNASDSEDNAASSASAASSSATAASASASAASSSASAAADSATAASASASAAATSATAADASADDAAASAAAAAAAVVPVPTGGAEGQVLAKASASDFDTEWADPGGTSEELSTRDYGAALDGVTNDYSAFTSIQTDRLANTNPLYGYGYGTQKTRVSFGVSLIGANTIDIYGTTRMEGDGTGVAGGGVSVLKFTGETTAGIRVQSGNTSGASSSGGSFVTGAGSIIDGLHLQGGYVSTPGEYHGIHVRATCVIRDTNIFNFAGSGVFADTTLGSGGATEGQFNLSRIDTVAVEGCKNGFYVHGGDANAGTFLNCSAIGNREYGFYDDSFLGNTWIACHAAGNTLGGYRSDPTNANQAPLFIGCYEEAGQPASVFGPRTLRVGGFWSNSDENSGGGIIAAVDDKVVTNDLSVLGGVEATGEAIVHGNITGRGNSFVLGPTTGTADNELRLIARNAFNQLSFYNNGGPQGSITARDNGTDYYFTEHRFHSANGGADYSKIDSTGMLFYGAGTSQYWKDATPTKASSVGHKVPGGAASDDLIISRYNGSAWAEAARFVNSTSGLTLQGPLLFGATTAIDSSGVVSTVDDAYDASWNGSLEVPTKNAVYDKIEALGSASDPWTYVFLGSDVTSTSTTPADVTGLSFTPSASTKYEFEGVLICTSAATTTGCQVGLSWPTGYSSGIAVITVQNNTSGATITGGGDPSAEIVASTTGAPSSTASFPATMRGTIEMGGSPSGNVQVRLRSEVAASQVAVKAGSWIKYRVIS